MSIEKKKIRINQIKNYDSFRRKIDIITPNLSDADIAHLLGCHPVDFCKAKKRKRLTECQIIRYCQATNTPIDFFYNYNLFKKNYSMAKKI